MVDWIVEIVNTLGYVGILTLTCLENLFPPIPSEVIIPLAGFVATKGELHLPNVILAGTIGSLLGCLPWYYAGKTISKNRLKSFFDRHGKWLFLSGEDIDKAEAWFNKHGTSAVFFCRLVPGVRTLISLPAGLHHMKLLPFLFFSALGTAIWTGLLAYLGYILGSNYYLVEKYVGIGSKIVLVSIIVAIIFWIVRRQRNPKI